MSGSDEDLDRILDNALCEMDDHAPPPTPGGPNPQLKPDPPKAAPAPAAVPSAAAAGGGGAAAPVLTRPASDRAMEAHDMPLSRSTSNAGAAVGAAAASPKASAAPPSASAAVNAGDGAGGGGKSGSDGMSDALPLDFAKLLKSVMAIPPPQSPAAPGTGTGASNPATPSPSTAEEDAALKRLMDGIERELRDDPNAPPSDDADAAGALALLQSLRAAYKGGLPSPMPPPPPSSAAAPSPKPAKPTDTASNAAAAAAPTSNGPALPRAGSTASTGAGGNASGDRPALSRTESIDEAIRMLSEGARGIANGAGGAAPGGAGGGVDEDEMLKKLFAQFEAMDPAQLDALANGMGLPTFGPGPAGAGAGAGAGACAGAAAGGGGGGGGAAAMKGIDELVQGLMGQMLSKEYLYPPMKEIASKYPDWLRDNSKRLSESELKNFHKQYECFQKICSAFETDAKDTTRILSLMQEVQTYGVPPKEIVSEFMKLPPPINLPPFPGAPGAAAGAGAGAGAFPPLFGPPRPGPGPGPGAGAGAGGAVPPFPNEAEFNRLMNDITKEAGDCKVQ